MSEIEDKPQPLIEHLIELRRRLIWAIVAFFTAFLVCFYFAKQLFNLLVVPYRTAVIWAGLDPKSTELIYTAPQEFFFTELKLALFGAVFGIEINLMFITGLLTVIGFSVHDSIVVFDRIRENVRAAPSASLAENVHSALLQTMARSMNTSITVLVTVAAMLALGGSTIQEFLLVILVGVIAGTYSSIGIASQLLVAWEEGDLARIFGRNRSSSEQTA